jgi:hypothetical protein
MKKLQLYFPGSDIKVTANLLWDQEPELCQQIWKAIASPSKMVCHHTISTGDVFVAFPRPPKDPPVTGTQANPIGKESILWSDLKAGDIFWRGWNVGIAYGKCTEPLNTGGALVGKVEEDDLPIFKAACEVVWDAYYYKHCICCVVLSRKEE